MNPASAGLGEERRNGFFVDTSGHCFLCLNKISSTSTVTTPTHSLQYLSRYLRLNLRKVLDDEVDLPPELVAKLEREKLRVSLCEGCAMVNERFSELCSQLERIRMEAEECLRGIYGKLIQSSGKATNEELQRRLMEENLQDEILTLRVADALRNQAINKCSNMLGDLQPRVLVKKLKLNGINPVCTENLRLPKSFSSPCVELDSDNTDIADVEDVKMTLHYDHDGDDILSPDKLECDICHPKVEDLSTHLYTAHFVGNREINYTSMSVTKAMEEPKPLKPPTRVTSTSPPQEVHGKKKNYIFNSKTRKYQCKPCGRDFSSREGWSSHYKNKHLQFRHKCPLCGREFGDKSTLFRHKNRVHLGMKFRCRTCQLVSIYRSQILSHQRKSRGPCASGQIEIITGTGTEKNQIDQHSPSQSQGTPVKVVEEPKPVKVSPPQDLQDQTHIFNSTTRKFQCKSCRREFASKKGCSDHYETVHLKVRYECPLCGKEFANKTTLFHHQNRVHLGVKFRCRACQMVSIYRSRIISHKGQFRGPCGGLSQIEVLFEAGNRITQSQSSVVTNNTAQGHGPASTSVKNWDEVMWECEDCGREFETVDGLQSHRDSVHSEVGVPYHVNSSQKHARGFRK